MRSCWLVTVLCLGHIASAQTGLQVDTVRALQPWAPHAEYTFPRLVLPERPAVAARINRQLAIDILEADPDTAGDDLFDMVWGDTVSGWMPRLNDISWEVRRPFNEIVEVELSAEGCGAYCEGFTTRRLFDLRDGTWLSYDSLFTPEGFSTVQDTLYRAWVAHLDGYILAMLDDLADKEIQPEYVEQVRGSLELYRNCMDERPMGEPYVEDFGVVPDGLSFSIARCAPHVSRELDELDPVLLTLSLAYCRPLIRGERRDLFH